MIADMLEVHVIANYELCIKPSILRGSEIFQTYYSISIVLVASVVLLSLGALVTSTSSAQIVTNCG